VVHHPLVEWRFGSGAVPIRIWSGGWVMGTWWRKGSGNAKLKGFGEH
jgi:hypothetical protein